MTQPPTPPNPLPVPCACGLPCAHLEGQTLVIVSRHHGARHRTVLDLPTLIALLEQAVPAPA